MGGAARGRACTLGSRCGVVDSAAMQVRPPDCNLPSHHPSSLPPPAFPCLPCRRHQAAHAVQGRRQCPRQRGGG
jgi:hypothetical protein